MPPEEDVQFQTATRSTLRHSRRRGAVAIAAVVLLAIGAWCSIATAAPSSQGSQVSVAQAMLLGVVEGLTEYLPVSSTGHLILASHAMGLSEFGAPSGLLGRQVVKSPAVSAFEIVIQAGAIIAVLGLYRARLRQMATGIVGRNPQGLRLVKMLALSAIPAMTVGLALHTQIQDHLFGPLTVSAALIAGGLLMVGVELASRRRPAYVGADIDQMGYWQALVIGLAQVLALWPGTSRSMVTIVAAIVVGMQRVSAAEFSFLLALPTLGAATIFEAASNIHALTSQVGIGSLLIGTAASVVVAAAAVTLFVRWLNHHGLIPFGVYRVLVGAAVLWYFRDIIV